MAATKQRVKIERGLNTFNTLHTELSYLCEFVALLCCALSLAGRITQSKDDRPLVKRRHVFNDLLGECSSDCSNTFGTNSSYFSYNNNEELRKKDTIVC